MGVIELLILAVGLSMDAFAVSVCKGLAMKKAGRSFASSAAGSAVFRRSCRLSVIYSALPLNSILPPLTIG